MVQSIIQNIEVNFCYSVHFAEGVFEAGNPMLRNLLSGLRPGVRVAAVLDEEVARAHTDIYSRMSAYLGEAMRQPICVLPGGEACKNDARNVDRIHRLVNEARLCRQSYLVAVGGGALLDLAGFAAATAHRGIRLVRVPTTVLAQNDSGVGVKNSINAFGKKNFLGTFAPPYAVVNDRRFLVTLTRRDWIAGVAEAVKVALIKDPGFFGYIEQQPQALLNRDADVMQKIIFRCAQLHMQHIASSGDPFERGSSRPLDFGHWSAHKLEQLTGFDLRHGEAVALGMAIDSTYAYLSGMLPEHSWRRILNLLQALEFPLHRLPPGESDAVFQGLEEFREHLGGELTIPMLRDIGHPAEVHEINVSTMRQAIDWVRTGAERPIREGKWQMPAQAA